MRDELRNYPGIARAYELEEARDVVTGFDQIRVEMFALEATRSEYPEFNQLTEYADELLLTERRNVVAMFRENLGPTSSDRRFQIKSTIQAGFQDARDDARRQVDLSNRRLNELNEAAGKLLALVQRDEEPAIVEALKAPRLRHRQEEEQRRQTITKITSEEERLIENLRFSNLPAELTVIGLRNKVHGKYNNEEETALKLARKNIEGIVPTERDYLGAIYSLLAENNKSMSIPETYFLKNMYPTLFVSDRPEAQKRFREMYQQMAEGSNSNFTILRAIQLGKVYAIDQQGRPVPDQHARTAYFTGQSKSESLGIGAKHRFRSDDGALYEYVRRPDLPQSRSSSSRNVAADRTARREEFIGLAKFGVDLLAMQYDQARRLDADLRPILEICADSVRETALDAHYGARDNLVKEVLDTLVMMNAPRVEQEIDSIVRPVGTDASYKKIRQNLLLEYAAALGELLPMFADKIIHRAQEICASDLSPSADQIEQTKTTQKQLEVLHDIDSRLSEPLPTGWLADKVFKFISSGELRPGDEEGLEPYNIDLTMRERVPVEDLMDIMLEPAGSVRDRMLEYFTSCQQYPISAKNLTQLAYGTTSKSSGKYRSMVFRYLSPSQPDFKKFLESLARYGTVLQKGSIIQDPESGSPHPTRLLRSFMIDDFNPDIHVGSKSIDGIMHNWETVPPDQLALARMLGAQMGRLTREPEL